LATFGQGLDLKGVMSPEEIRRRRRKMAAIVDRHKMTALSRLIDEIRQENVFTSCLVIFFEALRRAKGSGYDEAVQFLIKDSGYDLPYLYDMTHRIRLPIFNLYMERMRELLGNDLTADYYIGTQVHKARYGNARKLVEAIASPLVPVKTAHRFIPSGNESFNITKDFKIIRLRRTEALFDMIIFEGIDPVWDDICSRWFIKGIISALPGIWGMPDSQMSELLLQYNVIDCFRYYRRESLRLGLKEAFEKGSLNGRPADLILERVEKSTLDERERIQYATSVNKGIYDEKCVRFLAEEAEYDGPLDMELRGFSVQHIPIPAVDGNHLVLDGVPSGILLSQERGRLTDADRTLSARIDGILSGYGLTRDYLRTEAPHAIFTTERFLLKGRGPFGTDLPLLEPGQFYNCPFTRYHTKWQNPSLLKRAGMVGRSLGKGFSEMKKLISLVTIGKTISEEETYFHRLRSENLEEIDARIRKLREMDVPEAEKMADLEKWSNEYDDVTESHVSNVRHNCCRLGRRLRTFSADRILKLERCAILHDIGKAIISREILHKRGALNAAEIEEIQSYSNAPK
jgi:hypothetical protein